MTNVLLAVIIIVVLIMIIMMFVMIIMMFVMVIVMFVVIVMVLLLVMAVEEIGVRSFWKNSSMMLTESLGLFTTREWHPHSIIHLISLNSLNTYWLSGMTTGTSDWWCMWLFSDLLIRVASRILRSFLFPSAFTAKQKSRTSSWPRCLIFIVLVI